MYSKLNESHWCLFVCCFFSTRLTFQKRYHQNAHINLLSIFLLLFGVSFGIRAEDRDYVCMLLFTHDVDSTLGIDLLSL